MKQDQVPQYQHELRAALADLRAIHGLMQEADAALECHRATADPSDLAADGRRARLSTVTRMTTRDARKLRLAVQGMRARLERAVEPFQEG